VSSTLPAAALFFAISGGWRDAIELTAWAIAAAWCWRASDLLRYLPTIPDLTALDWDTQPATAPSLVVVVPARNEAANIAATLDALLLADYPPRGGQLRILAIDDRSTDGTGAIMDAYAAKWGKRAPGLLEVLHITDLPDGWLGKTFALHIATERSANTDNSAGAEGPRSDYLLFTDADVLFSPSILRRAMAYAVASDADHLVVMPTTLVKSRGEGIVLGFMQLLGMWAGRPWRIADAGSLRDSIGVGAFNLVRRDALAEIGGWAPQRLVVLEDITLGKRIKCAGLRQRIAFAPGLVLVHWAAGARGVILTMTKNLFSATNFQPLLLLAGCAWIVLFCLAPLAGLAWWPTLVPALLTLAAIGASYRLLGEISLIDARYGALYPLGAMAFIGAMLRSMVVVWWQRGVVWRGTLYELRDLRRHNSPLRWERERRRQIDDQRRAAKLVRRAARKRRRD
jgi:cellulose synthase/poly-beta-1,6-N-acetylglucosamine synthase-like glycosyltransferase